MGSRVWAHSYDGDASLNYSSVTELQNLDGAGARHLVVHPNGKWLYVIWESANEVAVYSRDTTTGELVDTNTTYSLLPDGFTNCKPERPPFSLDLDHVNSGLTHSSILILVV